MDFKPFTCHWSFYIYNCTVLVIIVLFGMTFVNPTYSLRVAPEITLGYLRNTFLALIFLALGSTLFYIISNIPHQVRPHRYFKFEQPEFRPEPVLFTAFAYWMVKCTWEALITDRYLIVRKNETIGELVEMNGEWMEILDENQHHDEPEEVVVIDQKVTISDVVPLKQDF
uniref:Uncharacterized protein n=1 Tax=Caenorhabditis japonica TaxID=281687 RepID=A0A8R1IW70_CAEJA